jgi:drug/metabolite transporter (DMT)-like permease
VALCGLCPCFGRPRIIIGYALWYAVLPATTAAIIQLSAAVIAALGGVLLLGATVTLRFGLASIAVLGGVLLVFASKQKA